jgi:hypothetical protein
VVLKALAQDPEQRHAMRRARAARRRSRRPRNSSLRASPLPRDPL